ncbi:phosphohydrolase [Desulfosarcina sp. OttesenSCG-928-A07]|nr:phosphohydrolase [Desulfosarcina sp. OttesenSCG-928-G17]MDL2330073.1 phosphohydrolase [Desulfosarcina sp. OttesenSCG-928-A07]
MKCPGQDTQYWKPGAIYEVACPQCGIKVEFFKDDTTRKCPACGHPFVNPKMDFGCAAYCPHAAECIGTLPEEFLLKSEDLFKDRVAIEMKRYFKNDFKRIQRVIRLARHAERIALSEGGNPAMVLCAAYLGAISRAEAKENSGPTLSLKPEMSASALSILEKLKAGQVLVDGVRDIIGRGSVGHESPLNSRILHDAEEMVRLEDEKKEGGISAETIRTQLQDRFLTQSGRVAAEAVLSA